LKLERNKKEDKHRREEKEWLKKVGKRGKAKEKMENENKSKIGKKRVFISFLYLYGSQIRTYLSWR
jgi:hypothetical protein